MNSFEQATHDQIARTSAAKTDEAIFRALEGITSDELTVLERLKDVHCVYFGEVQTYLYKGQPFIRLYPIEISTTVGVDGYHVVATRKYEVM